MSSLASELFLETFFRGGPGEVRAWSFFKAGSQYCLIHPSKSRLQGREEGTTNRLVLL